MRPPLLLGSTSPARRELLSRLGVAFEAVAPDYDESRVSDLSPGAVALHHALGKARAVASLYPRHVVIGSDQVADLEGEILGKPGTEEVAVAQLTRMSGRWVAFRTGLAVVQGERTYTALETYRVHLRRLPRAEIEAYVAAERPLGAAGSFHIEGLGIALMDELEGRDYTSLIGLPLIALTELLGRFGIRVLGEGTRGVNSTDGSS